MHSQTSSLARSYTTSKRNTSSRYDVTKPNKQHQFDLLYMPQNLFEGNMYKYILTGFDFTWRHKVTRPLRTKKTSEVACARSNLWKGWCVQIS